MYTDSVLRGTPIPYPMTLYNDERRVFRKGRTMLNLAIPERMAPLARPGALHRAEDTCPGERNFEQLVQGDYT